MKNLIKYLAVLVLIFGYTSCDELDKLTEEDFNTTVTESIPVNVVDGFGEEVLLTSNVVVNIVNAETQDILNDIKKVDILGLSYKVINFDGDIAGVMTVDLLADGVILNTLNTHTDVIVFNVVGDMYTIDDIAKLSTIASKLKNGEDVNFAVSGTSVNDGGMTFDIEITLSLKITVDLL